MRLHVWQEGEPLFLREVRLSDVAGMVARGEAVAPPHRGAPADGPGVEGADGVGDLVVAGTPERPDEGAGPRR